MIHHGDCLEVLRTLESDSLDSLVTDPPAGIAFMGKDWDKDKGGRTEWIAWMTEVMRECLRVLKPGAHGLVWALPRTAHWTATALEDAGFEVRDCVTHLFGTGFPKSLDVSKAIDKAAGAERQKLGPKSTYRKPQEPNGWDCTKRAEFETAPATDSAREWQGWGTALKPACEFWWLVRKPCSEKTVAANVLRHGTGAINVDGCRIGVGTPVPCQVSSTGSGFGGYDASGYPGGRAYSSQGRFPSNLVLSHSDGCMAVTTIEDNGKQITAWACEPTCAVRMLDEQSGISPSNRRANKQGTQSNGATGWKGTDANPPADSGGASRFFYCAKASRSDRQRKAKDGQQAPDRKEHVPDELFDPAGNPARGHSPRPVRGKRQHRSRSA